MDTYSCSVADFIFFGGTVSDAAWEASGSHVIDCINQMIEAAEMRLANSLLVINIIIISVNQRVCKFTSVVRIRLML